MMHGMGHSTEELKVIRECSEEYAGQTHHNKSHASGKYNQGKTVKFKSRAQETNIITQKVVYTVLLRELKKQSERNRDPEN